MNASRSPFEDVLNNATAALFIMDPEHRCTYMNPAAEALTGFTLEELRGRLLHDAIHHRRPDGTPLAMEECSIGATVIARRHGSGEDVFVHRDGHFYDVAWAASAIHEGEAVVGTVLEVHDITERKRAEAHRALLTSISDDIARGEPLDSVLARAAEGLGRLIGSASCELSEIDETAGVLEIATAWRRAGTPPLAGRHPLDAILMGAFPAELRRGEPVVVPDVESDERVDAAPYTALGIRAFMIAPFVREGAWRFCASVTCDAPRAWREDEVRLLRGVTARVFPHIERRRGEEALRLSEERFRLMADSVPHLVWITGAEGVLEFLNRQWTNYTGLDFDAEGRPPSLADTVHPDDLAPTLASFEAALAAGATFTIEHRMRGAGGDYRWFLVRAEPYRDPATGQVVRWFGTSVDIHDLKLAQQALADADRRKDEFLAMLAHELRNPLAPIATSAHLLDLAADDPRRVRDIARIIGRQVEHIRDLVDDLLDVSRVTRGLISLRDDAVDVASIVHGAIEQSRADIEARRHRLSVAMPPAAVAVRGDRTRLIQVVANLLNNAAKYSPDGSRIEVVVEADDALVRIAVSDTGQGIDPGLLPHVFELFAQGERTPDRAHGGLGLGLALVRNLVHLHGGGVEASSDGPGHGSRFTVTLPRASEPAPLAAPATAAPATTASDTTAGRRIVVVDDNADAAATLALALESCGYAVQTFGDASTALARAPELAPDAFLLDIGLPGMDGRELVRRLRADPALAAARYVALSGYGSPTDVEASRRAGFHRHLVKPVDLQQLLGVLAAD